MDVPFQSGHVKGDGEESAVKLSLCDWNLAKHVLDETSPTTPGRVSSVSYGKRDAWAARFLTFELASTSADQLEH